MVETDREVFIDNYQIMRNYMVKKNENLKLIEKSWE